jgi:hypothetical protein
LVNSTALAACSSLDLGLKALSPGPAKRGTTDVRPDLDLETRTRQPSKCWII